jgi:hypothetical protein
MKILMSLLLVSLFAGAKCSSQGKGRELNWIERLKSTPVAKMETGLPDKPFDQWLTDLSKSAQLKYKRSGCEAEDASSSGKCILVTVDVAPVRRLELKFAVPAESTANSGEAAVCKFVGGVIGPSDPRSKQPTRLVRKLGDLETMLK